MMAYCTACGGPRMPLTAKSVNMAGQPSQVTGTIARIVGWLVLVGGLGLSFILLAIGQAIVPGGFIGWAFFAPIAIATIICALALLRGGKNLVAEGKGTERQTKSQAILAMAQVRGGKVDVWDVSRALSIPPQQADILLTELAKSSPDTVHVDIDEASGTLIYRIDPSGAVKMRVFDEKVRVAAAQAEALEDESVMKQYQRRTV
jgi:hypothetical protein